MTTPLPYAAVIYLECRWWGWRVRATVGPFESTQRVLGTEQRAIRVGHQLSALLLEAQRRRRELAEGGT